MVYDDAEAGVAPHGRDLRDVVQPGGYTIHAFVRRIVLSYVGCRGGTLLVGGYVGRLWFAFRTASSTASRDARSKSPDEPSDGKVAQPSPETDMVPS